MSSRHLTPVQKLAEGQSGFAALFWRMEADLETLKVKLGARIGSQRDSASAELSKSR
jgi:hypothetical protein